MRTVLFFVCLLSVLWLFAGCEIVPPSSEPVQTTLDGLKLSDLQDTSQVHPNAEFLLELRILTYVLDTQATDGLTAIFGKLSQNDVRCANKDAFAANGLTIGIGKGEESARIAQTLYELGAVRISQGKLLLPPEQTEILSSIYLQNPVSMLYSASSQSASQMSLANCFIGWTMSFRPDPRLPKMVQMNLVPAFWQRGAEDIRLRMGKQPIDFKPLEAGRVMARIEEGGFVMLAPAGKIPEQTTLDKMLFFLAGRKPKVQFFIIICDKAGL